MGGKYSTEIFARIRDKKRGTALTILLDTSFRD